MHFRGYSDIGIKKKLFRGSKIRTKKSEENARNHVGTEIFWEKGLTSAADCCKIRSVKELLLCRFRTTIHG